MAAKYRYEGVREVRRLIRQLPGAATDELAGVMQRFGSKFLAAMRSNAPVRTGRLVAGLSVKFLRRTLRLQVGFVGKAINRKLFYGHIIQFGHKAKPSRSSGGAVAAGPIRCAYLRGRRGGLYSVPPASRPCGAS